MCFDKTGTLTEEGMCLKGLLPKTQNNQVSDLLIDEHNSNQLTAESYDPHVVHMMLNCMATCHSVVV